MAINTLTGTLTVADQWSATGALVNSALPFGAVTNAQTISLKVLWPTTGAGAGACNEEATGIQALPANTSATINLQSLTDVLGTSAVALVRLKKYVFCNLSVTQDSTAGTNCSSVTVGNAATFPHPLDMSVNTTTKLLYNGDLTSYGTNTANGIAVNTNTGGYNIKLANNDLTNAAAVFYSLSGSTT